MLPRKCAVALTGVVAALAALAPGTQAAPKTGVAVCNEAQNSQSSQHEFFSIVSDDPNPPARNKDNAMLVGNRHGVGLENAAANSPALAVCAVQLPPPP